MRLIQSFLLIFLSVAIFSCSPQGEDHDGATKIVILHTNDMHASLDNMPKLAAFKKEMEQQYEHVILVSAGDIFSGNPVVDFHEKKGYPMIDLMNRAGYQVSTLGNHEFDYGQKILSLRMKQADFPFICANLKTEDALMPQPEPYAVIEKGDIKLLFLGLIELGNEGVPSTHPEKVSGIRFTNPIETAGEFIHLNGMYNAFIGLTHLGYETDRELAKTYHQFDVIMGGHSHTLVEEPEMINNVLLTQAGDDLQFVGKVELTFEKGELNGRSASLINLDDYQETDEQMEELVKEYKNNESLSRVIGRAADTITGKQELGALFTDAQCAMHGLDFSFQNRGGIRIYQIPKGPIEVKTIYELDPFGNELIRYEMTPAEIKSLIANSYSRHDNVDLLIGGGSYTVKVDPEDKLQQVILLDEQGKELNPDSTYSVGLNSYIASSYQFDHEDEGKSLYVTTAQNIIEFIEKEGTIDYSGVKRVSVEKQ
jgi:2',3'-cyclic-nucleotide 2'-phosphodiesterase (5'-nucleotidase family)